MRFRKRFQIVLVGLLLGAISIPAQAQQNKQAMMSQGKASLVQQDAFQPVRQVLDINNLTTWLRNNGKFDYVDPYSGLNGTFPKATTGPVFAQGIVWGGKVRDGKDPALRVNGSTYASGMQPGHVIWDPATGSVTGPATFDANLHHTWRVQRNVDLTVARSAAAYYNGQSVQNTSDAAAQDFMDQFQYDWDNWPAHLGAPYEDVDGNGSYDPGTDVPGYPGADQTMWIVTNDLGGISEESYGSPAIGMEQQLTVWGYNFPSTSPLGNMSFIRNRLIYTGTPDTPQDAQIDSMYVVMWADPDVGTYSNDYAGTDTSLSLGYAYNASISDDSYQNYGLAPAAVGWDFLQGPVDQEGDTLGMTAFVYFAAGSDISDPTLGDYTGTQEWYNLMLGLRPQPPYPASQPFVNPITGDETRFTLTGDPVSGQGWIDGQQLPPGDRRIVMATGPFTVQKGDTIDVVVGQMAGLGQSNLSSLTVVRFYDEYAQYAYDNNFDLPVPAPVPPLSATELDEKVVLNWGFDHDALDVTENWDSKGFQFEGYNVYQLPRADAGLAEGVKVATFDKANLLSVIEDRVVDEETGFVIEKPVLVSPDEGLQRYITLNQDQLRSRPIANGVRYHYAVTAYAVQRDETSDAPFTYLESNPALVSVTPHPENPGVGNRRDAGAVVDVNQVGGSGDATILPEVVDPDQVVAADWTVTFNSDTTWSLQQGGSTVLSHRAFGISTDVPIVDGVQVNVADVTYAAPTSILNTGQIVGSGLSLWGDGTLFGNPNGYYATFVEDGPPPPTVAEAQADLEFRFTGNGGMEAPTTEGGQLASYWERAAFGVGDLSGLESEVIRMPFELWDVENDRQINFAVIGRNADAESPWGDGVGDYYRMAARDYIVPIMTEYDESQVQSSGTSPIADEATWLLFFEQGGASVWDTGDVYRVRFANPIQPGSDRFAFETSPSVSGVDSLLQASVEDINVFPNPYKAFSPLERNRYEKFVTFTHLPEEATIRIFSLAGTMVRVLNHDDPNSQFERWDLTNEDTIPVASGIYIAHVDTPYGQKVLKLAVVQEEQILQRY